MFNKANILRILSLEEGEETPFFLLLIQSVFLGIFFAVFEISSSGLFMNTFGAESLSKAYLVSGVVGLFFTFIFSKLQSIISFRRLSILNLLFISASTLLFTIIIIGEDSKALIFFLFVIMGPLNLLGMVGFWGVAGRIFSLRQGKRLFGLIDIGQVIGMFLISISIPFILKAFNDTRYLLFFSAGSSLIAMVVQAIISAKYKLEDVSKQERKSKKSKKDFFHYLKDNYIKTMSLYVVLSMAAAFTVVYIFLPAAKTRYPGNSDYTSFLGYFTAVLMIFIILFKTVAYSKLTKTYGLKFNLILPPALLILLTLGSTIGGMFFGFGAESKGFILFFIIASLSRVFSVSMKSSIEVPSQKILYQSLPNEIRHDVQVGVDGMVNEFSAISSGLLLVFMSLFSAVGELHYNILLLVILVLWTVVALKLYKNYRTSLNKALERGKKEKRVVVKEVSKRVLDEEISLNSKLHFNNSYILAGGAEEIGFGSKEEEAKSLNISDEKLSELTQSHKVEDRILAAQTILKSGNEKHSSLISLLLRDVYPNIRYSAIDACVKIKTSEVAQILIENLSDRRYAGAAFSSLRHFPDSILELLEQNYHRSGVGTRVKLLLLQLMKEVGKGKSIIYLLSKLNSPQIKITANSIQYLKDLRYSPLGEEERQPIINLFNEMMAETARLINIISRLVENRAEPELIKSLTREEAFYYSLLFDLMAIIYDVDAVEHIREHFEESSEGSEFAVELIDLLIEENMKFKILPFFEEISRSERVNRLKEFYPLQKYDLYNTYLAIVNSSPNIVGTWSKVLAIKAIRYSRDFTLSYDISAQIFNKELVIKELAAQTIFNYNTEEFFALIGRLGKNEQMDLKELVKLNDEDKKLLTNRPEFLKRIFESELDEDELIDICEELQYRILKKGEKIIIPKLSLFFISEGSISVGDKSLKKNSAVLLGAEDEVIVNKNTELFSLEGDGLYWNIFAHSFLKDYLIKVKDNL